MQYAPGITNRSGELLAAGIDSAARSIGDAIEHYGAKRDELKGYRQVALALGLPAEQVDKMSLGDIKGHLMANEIKTQQAQLKQKQQAQAAIQPFIEAFTQNMQPRVNPVQLPPAGRMNADLVSGDVPPMTSSPGQSPLDAILGAVASNPAVLNTDIGSQAVAEAFKQRLAPGKQPPQRLNIGGTDIIWNPSTGRDRAVPVPKPVTPTVPADWVPPVKTVNGVKMYQPGPGQAWKSVVDRESLFGDLMGGGGGGGSAPAAEKPAGPAKVVTQEDYDALESGAQYYDAQGNLRKKK